jgi:hypothetical protein
MNERSLPSRAPAARKRVVGMQVHHSVFLEDALRGAASTRAGLRSAIQRTSDADLIALAERADDVLRHLRAARDDARESLLSMPRHDVVSAREGFAPYPDELAEGLSVAAPVTTSARFTRAASRPRTAGFATAA